MCCRLAASHRSPASTVGQDRLFRAGLLHDIGKLGVSSRILDKPGPLTPEERRAVEHHPLYTWEILSHVTAFAELAAVASAHHEKLDGSGYPWGLKAAQLDFPSRILAVADMFEALTADRPYRAGMSRRRRSTSWFAIATRGYAPAALDALAAHPAALVVEL